MTKVSLLCFGVLCLVIAGCAPNLGLFDVTAGGGFVSYQVEFNARAAGTDLKTYSDNRNCSVPSGKTRKGCVRFEKDTFGVIAFSLRADSGANKEKCGDSGVQWVITKVEATVTADGSDDNKGGGWNAALPLWVTSSFYPIKDSTDGLLYEETDVNEARTKVAFINLNKNVETKVLWYRVTATNCADDSISKSSDPRVENDGLN